MACKSSSPGFCTMAIMVDGLGIFVYEAQAYEEIEDALTELRVNDLKTGNLVGTDKYGNKYYEDKRNFFGRHRWVVYTKEMNGKNTFWEVDGSMVPPECSAKCTLNETRFTKEGRERKSIIHVYNFQTPKWIIFSLWKLLFATKHRHRWLHAMTDDPPTTHPPVPRKFIWENHKFNVSGTPEQYVPYSTTRKKIHEWIPPKTTCN
uniref:NADH dehydrogenase [ubiquinone] 1 alpha subcomplex subunit 12 n=1 Tax=Cyanistes caeruleus TaxID=156563 RepID=A0A8C0UPA0_CYACU